MKTALYARVSTELQEKEQTIQSQLEVLRQYAAAHGYAVVLWEATPTRDISTIAAEARTPAIEKKGTRAETSGQRR